MVSQAVIEPSRDGKNTAHINGVYLHSKYSPESEISRLIPNLKIGEGIKGILLVNPGLPYLEKALSAKFSVFSIHSYIIAEKSSQHWNPESSTSLSDFIQGLLESFTLAEIFVYAWPPGLQADFKNAQALHQEVKELILSKSSSKDTTHYFRRVWIRNTVKNVFCGSFSRLIKPKAGVFDLCASGPSLEGSLDLLKTPFDQRMILVSSLRFFEEREIDYSCAIHADGGFWSLPLFYKAIEKPLFFALRSKISNAMLLDTITSPFAVSPLEQLVWNMCYESELPKIPEQGTVSLIGLEYIKSFHSGPVRIFGFDLATFDILSHARPHPNQMKASYEASRLVPWHHSLVAGWAEALPKALGGKWYSNHQLEIFKDNMPKNMIEACHWINSPHFKSKAEPAPAPKQQGVPLRFESHRSKLKALSLDSCKQYLKNSPLSKIAAEDLRFADSEEFQNLVLAQIQNYV